MKISFKQVGSLAGIIFLGFLIVPFIQDIPDLDSMSSKKTLEIKDSYITGYSKGKLSWRVKSKYLWSGRSKYLFNVFFICDHKA